jgi:hypothetical protein
MNTQISADLQVGRTQVALARERDFADLLLYSSKEFLFKTLKVLKTAVTQMGDVRNPTSELYKERLHSLRQALKSE